MISDNIENNTEIIENTDTNECMEINENNEAEVSDSVTEQGEALEEQTENQPEISEEKAVSVIEAVLFAMGGSVEISRLASVLEIDVKKTKGYIKKLQEKYMAADCGITITQLENAVQMCTKPELYEYLIKIAKQPRKYVLSESVMETLSIIAYKQPVTKAEIEKIRGVSCDHAVNKLMEFDLVEEVGRMDAPGRPLLFGTTEQFLRSFGVQSLEELPLAGTDAVESFREQAEQEAQLKLDI